MLQATEQALQTTMSVVKTNNLIIKNGVCPPPYHHSILSPISSGSEAPYPCEGGNPIENRCAHGIMHAVGWLGFFTAARGRLEAYANKPGTEVMCSTTFFTYVRLLVLQFQGDSKWDG
jgi:hypothetical protein